MRFSFFLPLCLKFLLKNCFIGAWRYQDLLGGNSILDDVKTSFGHCFQEGANMNYSKSLDHKKISESTSFKFLHHLGVHVMLKYNSENLLSMVVQSIVYGGAKQNCKE